jgi:hypothetical protein
MAVDVVLLSARRQPSSSRQRAAKSTKFG